jgi:hypothetical protein
MATTMPSKPIFSSTILLTPLALQASNSDFFIGREALAMSGNFSPMPPQNILMPPPVPRLSTLGAFLPVFLAKFSAVRVEKGNTVDEPAAQT